ncbi:putative SPBc2 prophage-derived antirepressor protein YoqD [Candidatus Desulfosporosinus infrequens]|uniref:Putative SPBc2 prophage-derived antirepressor protein YoqD n=1 Tax=Candidatus Desulfosporosinus infrequens TaxID=2043169 RepID=A0A2U3LGX4_9FIRM|nr:putative SPBc2 prophage-derived antirepressor protein YoqD [Candidatus Desulfosporosinus infrequens]
MNKLQVINQDGVYVIDSRDAAEMTDVRHSDLLAKIATYETHLTNGEFRSLDFFIPSTYIDAKGESRPCYLLTRKGCDMVANKMTGEKGVLFTATYVTKFEEMEKTLTAPKQKRTSSRVRPAIKDAFDTAEYLKEKLGISIGIAQAACIRAVETNSGLNLQDIAKCLPAAEHETGYLNPTEVGKRLGISAVNANKALLAKGLLEQQVDAKGNKDWRITEAGKPYGEEFPYVKNGHSGYQIRWNESVMEALTEKVPDDAQLTENDLKLIDDMRERFVKANE